MKKLIFAISCLIATIALCSCGCSVAKPSATPIPEINPANIITSEDVASIAGYTPVVDEKETKREGNVATVMYRSEPIGKNDPVEVKITQFNNTIGYEQIYAQYEKAKEMRTSAENIESLGQESYIAIPTIHVYDRGCLVEITAGSGGDEEQKEMLKKLGMTAAGRIEEIIPEYVADKK